MPVSSHPAEVSSRATDRSSVITADQAIAVAQARFPLAQWDHIHPAPDATGAFEVALRQPGEVQRSYGRTQVFIDQFSGEVLHVIDPNRGSAIDAFFASQFPLHNGEALGLPGRIAVFLAGLAPAALYASGLCLSCRKWRTRSRRRRAAGASAERR